MVALFYLFINFEVDIQAQKKITSFYQALSRNDIETLLQFLNVEPCHNNLKLIQELSGDAKEQKEVSAKIDYPREVKGESE